jgi:hypothetical protein
VLAGTGTEERIRFGRRTASARFCPGVVKTIDAEVGSAPQTIGRGGGFRGGAWNIDDGFCSTRDALERSANPGDWRSVTELRCRVQLEWHAGQSSADGRHVIYQVQDADPDRRGCASALTVG